MFPTFFDTATKRKHKMTSYIHIFHYVALIKHTDVILYLSQENYSPSIKQYVFII